MITRRAIVKTSVGQAGTSVSPRRTAHSGVSYLTAFRRTGLARRPGVASATEDRWADPSNEFLSCAHAGGVYQLFGLQGVGATTIPNAEQPLQSGHIGYHLRTGKHNLTEYDWERFMDFTDKHWMKGK